MVTFKEFLINEAKYSGFRTPDATEFEVGKNVRGNLIRRGMVLAMKYPSGEKVFVEVQGFTDNKQKYGESGIAYNSVKEMLQANDVPNLPELEELDDENEYGYHHYMVLRDLTQDVITIRDNLFNVYLYKGRWAVGSSAERVSFYTANYVPKKINEAKYHGHGDLPKVESFDDYHSIEARGDDLYEKLKTPVNDEELGFIEGMPGHYGYIGLFFEAPRDGVSRQSLSDKLRPPRAQIIKMVEKLLSEMHEDPKAVNFAECLVDGGSVYYSDPSFREMKYDGVKPQLYCEK